MAEPVPASVDKLLDQHRTALVGYERFGQIATQFAAATAALSEINAGLDPATDRLVTVAGPHLEYDSYIYVRTGTGELKERNKVQICGAMLSFIGDRLEVINGRLVLVDSELGGGISVSGLLQKNSTTELYDSPRQRSYDLLLRVVAGLMPGENRPIEFD